MIQCDSCDKWFSSFEIEEGKCVHCEEPWKEHPEASKGIDLPDGPPSYWDLLGKMQARPVRYEILLPFAHSQENSFVEATIYEGEGRYWYIEGLDTKFKGPVEAAYEVVRTADVRRLALLNEEFEKEFGNGAS